MRSSSSAVLLALLFFQPLNGDTPAPADTAPSIASRSADVQAIVDEFRASLGIPQAVVVSVVPRNRLLVSVERVPQQARFSLAIQEDFLAGLTQEELGAVVAHELGHVWIFTHHPYLHTEELANQIAMRLVSRDTLERVYAKVWQQVGVEGKLTYLPVKAAK